MSTPSSRTTVSVSKTTKDRLDKWRAAGQCYDGFLCQMVDIWEKMHNRNLSATSADSKFPSDSKR